MPDPRVSALCREFDVEIVGKHVTPGPGQTRAPSAIMKMILVGGEDTARAVMRTLAETDNTKGNLERDVIGAAFDLFRACEAHYHADPSKWLEVWDRCPVTELAAVAHDLRGIVPLRAALAGMIYERIWRAYGPRSTQPDLLDDRRKTV